MFFIPTIINSNHLPLGQMAPKATLKANSNSSETACQSLLNIQLIILMEQGRRIFVQVAQRVSELSDFSQVLECQQTRLQLKSFRLQKLLPEKAIKTYDRVLAKHKTPVDFNPKPDVWYESEKRLFAWFITFYTYFQLENSKTDAQSRWADTQGFPPTLDFNILSNVFFLKGADFLEFHWLVLLRSAEKVGWSKEEEEMLLGAINRYGMKWNEVSYALFLSTNKALFRAPKTCRERWLNHLDHSKVKGEWTTAEDLAILQYVGTEGKRWSKLVGVLEGRRTEHTIKNRFNAMVAKHRRYKMESDIKVAERILPEFRKRLKQETLTAKEEALDSMDGENGGNGTYDIRFKAEAVSPEEEEFGAEVERSSNNGHQCKQICLVKVQEGKCASSNHLLIDAAWKPQQKIQEIAINQANIPQPQFLSQPQFPPQVDLLPQQQERQIVFPFQTFSYQMEMYNQLYTMQQSQMIYYQMMNVQPAPTADTTTREKKLLEQRRRRRENPRKE